MHRARRESRENEREGTTKRGDERKLKAKKKNKLYGGNRNSARDKTSQTIVIQWSEQAGGEYAGRKRAIQRGIERKISL